VDVLVIEQILRQNARPVRTLIAGKSVLWLKTELWGEVYVDIKLNFTGEKDCC
jgi:hypothetical protein